MFHPVLQRRASFLQVAVGCDGDDEEGPAACVAEDGRGRRWVARTAGAVRDRRAVGDATADRQSFGKMLLVFGCIGTDLCK